MTASGYIRIGYIMPVGMLPPNLSRGYRLIVQRKSYSIAGQPIEQ